ncbi:hypothetical protein AYO22_04914 [Fonsecaea multimorphosa]|nr:hypothetical protein AYO22_04914 [Fonsecaea multimorphosa]
MVRPTSSNGDEFLEKFTTDALLHGVEEFSKGEKRRFSLNDLKRLAAHAASDLTGDEGPRHDDATASDVNALNNQLHLSMPPLSIKIPDSPQPIKDQLQQILYQTAEDCNDLKTECPSVQPSNQNRGQPHADSEKQDVNRTLLPASAASRQLVSPTCRPGLFWNGFSEMRGRSPHVCHSENRLGDGELSLCADSNLEFQGCAADSVHPTRPLPANPVVVGILMNRTEALDAVVGSPSELDEFDRKLLGLETELALSASGAMVDRESPLYGTDVERSLRDSGGYWCGSLQDGVADGHQAHDPFGGRGLRNVSMDNSLSHGRQELSQPHRHVSQGPSEGFSGFSRRHVLY